jgi:hypothetical protein
VLRIRTADTPTRDDRQRSGSPPSPEDLDTREKGNVDQRILLLVKKNSIQHTLTVSMLPKDRGSCSLLVVNVRKLVVWSNELEILKYLEKSIPRFVVVIVEDQVHFPLLLHGLHKTELDLSLLVLLTDSRPMLRGWDTSGRCCDVSPTRLPSRMSWGSHSTHTTTSCVCWIHENCKNQSSSTARYLGDLYSCELENSGFSSKIVQA